MGRRGKGLKTLRKTDNNEICKRNNKLPCLKTGFGRVYVPGERNWWIVNSHSFVKLDLLLSNRATQKNKQISIWLEMKCI